MSDDELKSIRRITEREQEQENPDAEYVDRTIKMYTEMYAEQFEEQSKVIRAASRRARKKIEPGSCKGGHYEQQFGGYGNIFNLPIDIHPHWLAACYEMAEYVKDVNIYYQQMLSYFELIQEMRALERKGKAWKAIYNKRMKAIYKECDVVYAEYKEKQEKTETA